MGIQKQQDRFVLQQLRHDMFSVTEHMLFTFSKTTYPPVKHFRVARSLVIFLAQFHQPPQQTVRTFEWREHAAMAPLINLLALAGYALAMKAHAEGFGHG